MYTEPCFAYAKLKNIAGKLKVTWEFNHTGGVPILSVMLACYSSEMGDSSNSSRLMESISCASNEMMFIPIGIASVTAGMNYSCTVTAINKFSSVQHTTNYIVATSGQLLYLICL